MDRAVYVNRTLNMKRINYIGLDMDHTLIRYKSHNFEALAHKIMLEKLVSNFDYPPSVLDIEFDFNRAIRGLVIDKQRGNILKLSRYGAIRGSWHGLNPIDYQTQKKIYKSTYIDLGDPSFDTVDTTFSIAFAGLFGQLVNLKDTQEFSSMPEYATIAEHLNAVLDLGHRDGSIKSVVAQRLEDFIIRDEEVVKGLERYKRHGKKIFILTNSDYHYSKLLLDYAVNPYLKDHADWSELFEFVITFAAKPRFFIDKMRFLKIDQSTGWMSNQNEKLVPGIYQGGCASIMTADLGISPDEILYIGDHIYGDIVRIKKDCAWRTALVIEELEDEIIKNQQAEVYTKEITKLMDEKIPFEKELDLLFFDRTESGNESLQDKIDSHLKRISDLDHKISPLIKQQQSVFNPYWGEVMRVGIEQSYFAYQIERFACVYMARLSDLLKYPPRTYFRSQKHLMPHDIEHKNSDPSH